MTFVVDETKARRLRRFMIWQSVRFFIGFGILVMGGYYIWKGWSIELLVVALVIVPSVCVAALTTGIDKHKDLLRTRFHVSPHGITRWRDDDRTVELAWSDVTTFDVYRGRRLCYAKLSSVKASMTILNADAFVATSHEDGTLFDEILRALSVLAMERSLRRG